MRIRLVLALCLAGFGAHAEPGTSLLRFTGGVGGISAIDLSSDGRSFVALSDRGWLISGQLIRDAHGQLLRAEHGAPVPLTGPDGSRPNRGARDTEGLVWDGQAEILISYEGRPRLWRHDLRGRFLGEIAVPDAFADLPRNRGLEALAAKPGWGLLALPEQMGGETVPLWVRRPGGWRTGLTLSKAAGFAPVGADIGPDGHLYVLMRKLSALSFATQVLRIHLDTGAQSTIWQSPRGGYGNLEGLAVWRDGNGQLRLTMTADNNQNALQYSHIVEYTLPD